MKALQLIIFQVEGLHEIIICLLQTVLDCFLLALCRLWSFLAPCRLFQFTVDWFRGSGCFLLVVDPLRSFQAVSGHSAFL